MPFLKPFLRVVAIGTIYGVDTFSYSFSLISASTPGPSAPTEIPEEIQDAFAAFHATTGMISQQAALTTLKINLIGEDGRYVNSDTVLYDYETPVAGGAGTSVAPQIAYAVSLATAAARGRAHAGRFYLPLPAAQPSTGGVISDTAAQLILQSARDLLEVVEETLTGWQLGVVSDLGTGTQRFVTGLRGGRVLDTIRSRRAQIPEDYEEIPFPSTP